MNNSDRKPVDLLTDRELEILCFVAVGMPNDEISQRCDISPNTVKNHLHSICLKINASDRFQAMLWAGQNL